MSSTAFGLRQVQAQKALAMTHYLEEELLSHTRKFDESPAR